MTKALQIPKIHKPNIPFRPIVSAVNSPIHRMEKYLAGIMTFRSKFAASFVKNFEHLVNILKSIQLNENDILSNLDIKTLHPSMPIDESLSQTQ